MPVYITYDDRKTHKIYKLYYNYETLMVRINDGCYEFNLSFNDDELTSSLIKRFEDMVSDKNNTDTYLNSLDKEEEMVD